MNSLGLVSRRRIGPLLFAIQEISVKCAGQNASTIARKYPRPAGCIETLRVCGSLMDISTALAFGAQTRKLQVLSSSNFAPSGSEGPAITICASHAYLGGAKLSIHSETRVVLKRAQRDRPHVLAKKSSAQAVEQSILDANYRRESRIDAALDGVHENAARSKTEAPNETLIKRL